MHIFAKGSVRIALLTSTAGIAIASAPAAAQSETASATSDDSVIIVTAQKRAERFEDVPISITAVSGEQVERAGITNLRDVGQLTVGVNFSNNGPQVQPTIRGITSLTGTVGQDNNVAIYIDGVYQTGSTTLNQELLDLKSVQILKGPQGTLFGRNSTAGAILVETLDPEFEFSGKLRAGYGRFNEYALAGYMTAPLAADVLAFNVSASYRKSDGFNRDLFDRFDPTPDKDFSVRGKLLFQPSSDLKFIVTGEYSRVHKPWTAAYVFVDRNTVAFENPGVEYSTRPHVLSQNEPVKHKVVRKTVSLRAEWDLPFATLKSITAYADEFSTSTQDGDGTPIPRSYVSSSQPSKTFTQEVNLGGTTGRLDWVVGGFYVRQNAASPTFIALTAPAADMMGPIFGPIELGARPRAWALFADGTYKLTDRLAVIAGVRYSWEKKTLVQPYPRTTTDPNEASASRPFLENNRASETWNDVTPRIGLRYEVADRTNIYASYTKGFKSGSYGSSLPSIPNPNGPIPSHIAVSNPVNPEKADAFEIGFKTAQPGWRFNFAAFYYDYKDLQVQTSSLLPPPNPPVLVTQLTNAASSEIYGLEFSGSVDVTENLTVSGGIGWTHSEYKDYTGAQAYGICPVTLQTINGKTGFFDATGFVEFTSAAQCIDTSLASRPAIPDGFNTRATGLMDRSGDTLLRSPKWSANLSVDYTAPTGAGEVGFNLAANYTSKYGLNDLTPVGPGDRFYRFAQQGYVMINAQLSLRPKFNENLKFTLWGRNLADEVVRISGLGSAGDRFVFGPPLTYGFQVDFEF